jgi:hypothetical protein
MRSIPQNGGKLSALKTGMNTIPTRTRRSRLLASRISEPAGQPIIPQLHPRQARQAAARPARRFPAGCGRQCLAGRRTGLPRLAQSRIFVSCSRSRSACMSDLFDGLDVTPAPRAGQVPADELHLGLLAFASEPRCRQSTPSAPCRPWPPIDLPGPKGDPIR